MPPDPKKLEKAIEEARRAAEVHDFNAVHRAMNEFDFEMARGLAEDDAKKELQKKVE